jgi:hypothetical protein
MTGMSPTQQQLRRIDQQLTHNRQQIAVMQLENVKLEEARLVLLSLAEQDAIAAGRPGMAGLQILVTPAPQKVPQITDDGAASRAAKYGIGGNGRPLKGPRPGESEETYQRRLERDRKRGSGKDRAKKQPTGAPDPRANLNASPRGEGKHHAVAANVVKLLRKNGELLTGSMVKMLDLKGNRQTLSNALYSLKKDGVIDQHGPQQPYFLVEQATPNGGAHHG